MNGAQARYVSRFLVQRGYVTAAAYYPKNWITFLTIKSTGNRPWWRCFNFKRGFWELFRMHHQASEVLEWQKPHSNSRTIA